MRSRRSLSCVLAALALAGAPAPSVNAIGDCAVSTITRRAAGAFGWSASMDESTVVIGAPEAHPHGRPGAAVIYERVDDATVAPVARLFPDGRGLRGLLFGYSVAVDDGTVFVTAPAANAAGNPQVGKAFVYEGPGVWTQVQEIVPSDAYEHGFFGDDVDLDGDLAVIGASQADADGILGSGVAYVYERSGGSWIETARLLPAARDVSSTVGSSVAICDQDTILVGGSSHRFPSMPAAGAAWIFVRSGSAWVEQAMLTASDRAMSDNFGLDVACDTDTAVVGSPLHDHGGGDNGAAYVYRRSGTVWTQLQELLASPPRTGEELGFRAAINADLTIVLGAPGYAALTPVTGAVRVFEESAGTWTETQELVSPRSEVDDNFGRAVATDLDSVVVGAPLQGTNDAGAAFLFWGPCP